MNPERAQVTVTAITMDMGGCALPMAVGLEEQRQLNSKDVLGDACYFLQNSSPLNMLFMLAHCLMGPLLLLVSHCILFYFILIATRKIDVLGL